MTPGAECCWTPGNPTGPARRCPLRRAGSAARRGQRHQEDAPAADQAPYWAAPAGELPHHGQYLLAHRQHCGQGRKHHKQEEQGSPPAAAIHVVEHGGHGVKQQAGAGVDLHPIGKAGREHDQPRHDGHKGIQQDDVHRLPHQGPLLADVAAENGHGADAQRQREKGLSNGRVHHIAGDPGQVRHQVKPQALRRTVQGEAVNSQHQHQQQKQQHHVFGDPLQAALQAEAQNAEGHRHRHRQIGHVDARVRDHCGKPQILAVSREKLHEIVHDPAGDHRVKRHQGDAAE